MLRCKLTRCASSPLTARCSPGPVSKLSCLTLAPRMPPASCCKKLVFMPLWSPGLLAWPPSRGGALTFRIPLPLPLDCMKRRCHGGTAVLWRRNSDLGKAAPVAVEGSHSLRHRLAAVSFKNFMITSVYGPAHGANTAWFAGLFPFCTRLGKSNSFLIGDFNYKPCYGPFVPNSWTTNEPKPTTQAGSAPSRALATNAIAQVRAVPLPGIPHHFAVTYSANIPDLNASAFQVTRLKRCASYRWISKSLTKSNLIRSCR